MDAEISVWVPHHHAEECAIVVENVALKHPVAIAVDASGKLPDGLWVYGLLRYRGVVDVRHSRI